jgi:hypothetical protein
VSRERGSQGTRHRATPHEKPSFVPAPGPQLSPGGSANNLKTLSSEDGREFLLSRGCSGTQETLADRLLQGRLASNSCLRLVVRALRKCSPPRTGAACEQLLLALGRSGAQEMLAGRLVQGRLASNSCSRLIVLALRKCSQVASSGGGLWQLLLASVVRALRK